MVMAYNIFCKMAVRARTGIFQSFFPRFLAIITCIDLFIMFCIFFSYNIE